jgi:multimeric flavodoxin WrbA
LLLGEVMTELEKHGAEGSVIRAVDHNIKPGVTSDEGDGDDWPALRQRVVNSVILIMATPIWLGQPSSVAKRVMERMNAPAFSRSSRASGKARLGWAWRVV